MASSTSLPHLSIIGNPQAGLRAMPGQFFLAVPHGLELYFPQVIFPFRTHGGLIESFIVPAQAPEQKQLIGMIRGPYGRGFALPGVGRKVLLLASNATSGALLLPLLSTLVGRNCEIALLCGIDSIPENWLPPEVEYHIVEDVIASASEFWAWADALYASGPRAFYDQLLEHVKKVKLRLDEGWGEVILHDLAMPCGTGICYLCALRARSGLALNCRDGPVHDLADWMVDA